MDIFRSGNPGITAQSDDELMIAAQQGNNESFSSLVKRHQQRAILVAQKYLGGTAGAVDAVQDTFVEIYRSLPRYRAEGKFQAFFYRILINRCRMFIRSRRNKTNLEAQWSEASSNADTALDAHAQHIDRRSVDRAVNRLSHKVREVIALRFAGGFSQQEIAAQLKIPVGTVKSRLHSGLKQMREYLEETSK